MKGRWKGRHGGWVGTLTYSPQRLYHGFHYCILGVHLATAESTVKTVSIKVLLCY